MVRWLQHLWTGVTVPPATIVVISAAGPAPADVELVFVRLVTERVVRLPPHPSAARLCHDAACPPPRVSNVT